jgi:hypothetical protein
MNNASLRLNCAMLASRSLEVFKVLTLTLEIMEHFNGHHHQLLLLYFMSAVVCIWCGRNARHTWDAGVGAKTVEAHLLTSVQAVVVSKTKAVHCYDALGVPRTRRKRALIDRKSNRVRSEILRQSVECCGESRCLFWRRNRTR